MKFNELSVRDKKLFDSFLHLTNHELSVYAFENIYVWKALFDIRWAVEDDSLCIFFQDKTGMFMYLPPLCERLRGCILEKTFAAMNGINKNRTLSRIENIEEKNVAFYEGLGYKCREKAREYLCRRQDLAELKGDKFKSKRAPSNYFTKHYKFEYLPFSLRYKDQSLDLYDEWAKIRRMKNADYIYRGMIEDNYAALNVLLDNYNDLAFEGRIIRVGSSLKGFTFGFRLNENTFCILYEVTDLNIRGISQYIFQRFCSDLSDYRYINIMDDSGFENLKKVKLSYHPARLIPAYIARVRL